tara:strand:+ start:6129 stop:6272 length:144 start_codon:yes stop_codon:yes gene_type:complete
MKNNNPDHDYFDSSEEYFKQKDNSFENEHEHEKEDYFPKELSKPPHY